MNVAEGALGLVLQLVFIRRVRGNSDAQIVSAAGFQSSKLDIAQLASDLAVERPADHILLLLRCQPDEVDRIAGHADRELRVLVRVFHGVFERILVDHVQVHVEPAMIEVDVESLRGRIDEFALRQVRLLRRRPRRCS